MLSVVGAGYAYPQTSLTNKCLDEIAGASAPLAALELGIERRFSALPYSYLCESGNTSPRSFTPADGFLTATALGAAAAKMALARANLTPQDIGLVLVDCVTPEETCPAEAHRLAGTLGIKAPGYDVLGYGAALSLFASDLLSWKEERIPNYVLCVSSNTATRKTSYRGGLERFFFGDAAGALILAKDSSAGTLKLADAHFATEPLAVGIFEFGLFDTLSVRFDRLEQTLQELTDKVCAQARSELRGGRLLLLPDVTARLNRRVCDQVGATDGGTVDFLRDHGHCAGASALCAIAERWDDVQKHGAVVVQAGAGGCYGYSVLTV